MLFRVGTTNMYVRLWNQQSVPIWEMVSHKRDRVILIAANICFSRGEGRSSLYGSRLRPSPGIDASQQEPWLFSWRGAYPCKRPNALLAPLFQAVCWLV